MGKIFYILSFIFIAPFVTSCSDESDVRDVNAVNDDVILIGAAASEILHARSYEIDGDDNIIGGKFWLTYPTKDSKINKHDYKRLTVDFNSAKYYPDYQRYYVYPTGGDNELTWSIVGTTPNYLFLDNVDPAFNKGSKDTLVVFDTNNNPYMAGLMDTDKDILWGRQQPDLKINRIDFDLHHVMAGVRVKITVDKSDKLMASFDLTTAQVFITQIIHRPKDFDRITGDVHIDDSDTRSNLYLINNMDKTPDDYTGPENSYDLVWKEINKDNTNYPVFITHEFILPPQTPDENNWPELVIRFPDPEEKKEYKEYYGKLPKGMFTDYPNATNYGLDLSFLREHILEIRTQISQTPPQLIFMPVKVYDWIKWGPYTLTGNQEGIYDREDLMTIINYYKVSNETMLGRFGENVDGIWHFNIWRSFKVKESEVKNVMPITSGKADYKFSFLSKCTVTVTDDNDTPLYVISSSSDLVNLLSQGIIPGTDIEP